MRQRAKHLQSYIDSVYNMPDPNSPPPPEPDVLDLQKWSREVDDLIQSHHDPDYPPLEE